MSIELGASIVSPIAALFKGSYQVIADPKLRALALKPWGFGLLSWIVIAFLGFSFHSSISELLIDDSSQSWLKLLGWFGATIGIFIVTSLLSFSVVMIGAAVYQTDIARIIFEKRGLTLPPTFGVTKTVITETLKLLLLLPLMIICFIFGLIPLLTPIAFILGSWLIAVQFLDTALDSAAVSPSSRLKTFVGQPIRTIVFGIPFAILICIPFVAFLLPPFAVAAAAELANLDSKTSKTT